MSAFGACPVEEVRDPEPDGRDLVFELRVLPALMSTNMQESNSATNTHVVSTVVVFDDVILLDDLHTLSRCDYKMGCFVLEIDAGRINCIETLRTLYFMTKTNVKNNIFIP